MKILMEIRELLEEELKDIKKRGSISTTELDGVKKAVETIKYIDEICRHSSNGSDAEEYGNKYSGMYKMPLDNYSILYDDNRYSRDREYSGRGMRGMRGRMYSRDGATSHMVDKLEGMMDQATNDREREAIQTCIDKLSW